MKLLLVLLIGIAFGYSLGWKDARAHRENVVTRVVNRAGGASRGRVGTDVDKQMRDVERRAPDSGR